MKLFRYIKYALRDTARSLNRHKEMSFISIFMVFITMIILGSISLISLNGYFLSQELENDLEISIFLKKNVTSEMRVDLEKRLEKLPGYASHEFISKDKAYENLAKKLSEKRPLADKKEVGNPLPDAYTIKFVDGEKILGASEILRNYKEVDSVNTSENVVSNVLAFNKTFMYIIESFMLIMVIVVILLINGTIKLTVLSRKQEIEIMKYIGATNLFVKLPFYLEGLLIGLIGSGLAVLSLYYGYDLVVNHVKSELSFFPVYNNELMTFYLLIALLAFGCFIGIIGSSLAIKKHLKV